MAAIFGGHAEINLVYFHWVSTTMHAKIGLEISVRSLAIDIIEWFFMYFSSCGSHFGGHIENIF